MQKKPEPGAFTSPSGTDAVHPIVPITGAKQREPVNACSEPFVNCTDAVLEDGSGLTRDTGRSVRFVFVSSKQWCLQVRHPLAQNEVVAGGADVCGDDVGEPQQVVGATGSQSTSRGLMPPVLDVAFQELPPSGAKQMLAGQRRLSEQQRQHVLQLIPESKCTARLVVAGTCPQPTAHVLIEQPAIQQAVKGVIWSTLSDNVEHLVPRRSNTFERACGAINATVLCNQAHRLIPVLTGAEEKYDFVSLAALQHDSNL